VSYLEGIEAVSGSPKGFELNVPKAATGMRPHRVGS
jgi:hypothetical protein